MSEQKTVVIKGVTYDIATGKPVANHAATDARAIHANTSKSHTLNRRYVAPPTTAQPQHTIQKFAPHPSTAPKPVVNDIAPLKHPMVAKAHTKQAAAKQARVIKPSQVIKQEAINDALAKSKSNRKQLKVKKTASKAHRFARIATATAAIMLLAGYLTYLTMPSLSTRIAAAQAGINAKYPSYLPSGYALSGPVTYDSGMVTINFSANASPQSYTVAQTRSSWDSTAVRENYVQPKAGQDYLTTRANGLTIYTYGHNAAWVNGGILYTITGNAPLSNEQVQRIAISM